MIRIRSLDKSVAETTDKDALVNQIEYQRYWVSVNKGHVAVGRGELDERNKIFEWTDPYPIDDVVYVGISTWNAPVSFKGIQVYPCSVENVEEFIQKLESQFAEIIAKHSAKKQTAKPTPIKTKPGKFHASGGSPQ